MNDKTSPDKPTMALDAADKLIAARQAMGAARDQMLRDSLLPTNTSDDFFETSNQAVRRLVEQVFEAAYRRGLHTGYRQGRRDACAEADGRHAPSSPRTQPLNWSRLND